MNRRLLEVVSPPTILIFTLLLATTAYAQCRTVSRQSLVTCVTYMGTQKEKGTNIYTFRWRNHCDGDIDIKYRTFNGKSMFVTLRAGRVTPDQCYDNCGGLLDWQEDC